MAQKYPSTPHLPFSPGVNKDDITMDSLNCSSFLNTDVIITEKLDGGNCQLYRGKIYARTTKSEATHPSFGAIKQLYPCFAWKVPDNIALYGENMMGIHSIEYKELESYFYLFGALKDNKYWLGWDELVELANDLEIPTVPVLFEGRFKKLEEIKKWMEERRKKPSVLGAKEPEGFVIRVRRQFQQSEFEKCIAKYVRPNHIQTDETWLRTWKQAKLKK